MPISKMCKLQLEIKYKSFFLIKRTNMFKKMKRCTPKINNQSINQSIGGH